MKPIKNNFFVNKLDCFVSVFYKNKNDCEVRLRTLTFFPDDLELYIDTEKIEIPKSSKRIRTLIFDYKTETQLQPIHYTDTKIPKTIIQTGTEAELTEEQKLKIEYLKDLNPEYTYKFIEYKDRRGYINDDKKHIYDTLENSFVYFYALQEGGCYIGLNNILRKPIRDIIQPHDDVVIFENVNSCFFTTKNNGKVQAFLNGCKNPFFTIKDYPYLTHTDEKKVDVMRNKRELKDYIVLVYPHPYPDVFEFEIISNRLLKISRSEPWWLELCLKIIDKKQGTEHIVYVGASKDTNVKTIVF